MRHYISFIPVLLFAVYTTFTTNKKLDEMYEKNDLNRQKK